MTMNALFLVRHVSYKVTPCSYDMIICFRLKVRCSCAHWIEGETTFSKA